MTRPLRIEYPNAWYHVMNRGRRGENIFSNKTDFEIFLGVLQESSELFGCRVAAFCLMSNHYHLLLQTPLGNLSRVMRHVNGVYTQRYNRRQKVDGQLFRGRYKSVLVEEDSHLIELLRYIHRNPVRAHICKSVSDYRWSSHHVYVLTAKKSNWLYTAFLLSLFSETPGKAITEYKKFVQGEESEEIKDFFNRKNLPSIFGSCNFVEWVKEKYYQKKRHDEVPQSKDLAPTIIEIKKVVGLCYRIDIKELEEGKRGQEKEPRNVAIYLARKHSGLSLTEIGKEFGCIKYSTVSNVVRRIENQLAESNQLLKKITLIRQKLSLEQRKIHPLLPPFKKVTLLGEMRVTQDTVWHMPPNKERSLMLAKRQLSELVYDAVNLEGIPFTLPEIQTLLDGITVGGHKVTDQEIALNQANGWRTLFRWVEQGDFAISAQKASELHAIAGKNEALAWGKFRTGSVTIAGTDHMPPSSEDLPLLFESLVDEIPQIVDIYDRAIHVFLTMARSQFFYDVNKRMGRFMMNGLLLNEGYPAINLPAKRQLEFNTLMLEFYQTGQQKPMNHFLRSCLDERTINIMKEE